MMATMQIKLSYVRDKMLAIQFKHELTLLPVVLCGCWKIFYLLFVSSKLRRINYQNVAKRRKRFRFVIVHDVT